MLPNGYAEWTTNESLEKLKNWAGEGLTLNEIANKMNFTPRRLSRLRERCPEVEEALKNGKKIREIKVQEEKKQEELKEIEHKKKELKIVKDMLSEMNHLTPKQKKFIEEFLFLRNIVKSAERAGYSCARISGNETMRIPAVKKAIEDIQLQLAMLDADKIATPQEVLRFFTSIMRGDTPEEVVVIEGKGKGISQARLLNKIPDMKDRIKAGKLIGQGYGLFTENVKADINVTPTIISGDEDLE